MERRMKRCAHPLPESSVRMSTLAASGNSNAKGRVRDSPKCLVKFDPAWTPGSVLRSKVRFAGDAPEDAWCLMASGELVRGSGCWVVASRSCCSSSAIVAA